MQHDILNTEVTTIDGQKTTLADYAGRVLLIVNVASKCGLTPQYEQLEELQKTYGDRGFTVLGFPCNQFGAQEPGGADEIGAFCERNYGVTFPVMAKTEVNGPQAHPLFAWLKAEAPGLLGSSIKWNFTKFLIGRDDQVIRRYAPNVRPESIAADIEAALAA